MHVEDRQTHTYVDKHAHIHTPLALPQNFNKDTLGFFKLPNFKELIIS